VNSHGDELPREETPIPCLRNQTILKFHIPCFQVYEAEHGIDYPEAQGMLIAQDLWAYCSTFALS